MAVPIVIDCDPGHDDAIALWLALASPELDIRGVSAVAGNQTLSRTAQNAAQIVDVAGADEVPVGAGVGGPLLESLETAGEVHGEDGLGGTTLPPTTRDPYAEHGIDLMARVCGEADEPVTLIATGPLTNVALALRRHPDLTEQLERIVFMGGSLGEGNVSPVAEFNIYADPHAAAIVLAADVETTMVGLNVTRKAGIPAERFDEFRQMGNSIGSHTAELLTFGLEFHASRFGWDWIPVHDALAVAGVVHQNLLETERMHVAVETESDLTRGVTVCDRWGVTGNEPNVDVAVEVDASGFRSLLFDRISAY